MGRRRIVLGMPPGATPPVHVNYRAASSRTRTSRSNARDFIIGNIAVSPLYDRVDAFSFYRGIRVSEKKNIEKNIYRFFNSSVFFPLIRTENYLVVRSTVNEPLDPFSKNFYSESFEYLNLGSIETQSRVEKLGR